MTLPATHTSSLPIQIDDGHRFEVLRVSAPDDTPRPGILFLPALGVAARHYLPLAGQLADTGLDVAIHEWRGHGSSNLRASRRNNWGFQSLLLDDLPASVAALADAGRPVTVIAGHSLGGQLAACLVALHPQIRHLWLVASGSPGWKTFPAPLRWSLPLIYTAFPALANVVGHLPGQRVGFGGREARGLIADWAHVGRSGHYRVPQGIEQRMQDWDGNCLGISLANDWLAPDSSLQALQAKLPNATHSRHCIAAGKDDPVVDHFSWMKHPQDVVLRLAQDAKKFSQNR